MMMISIRVASYKGQPPLAPVGFDFDESGGSIGRRDSNQLVLRDPDQQISREQARVLFRNGGFELIDQGKSPTIVNGQALGNGQSIALRSGDELQIGDYRLVVVDPAQQRPAPSPAPSALAAESTVVMNDPLGLFGGPAALSGAANPFADLLNGAGSAPPTPETPPADIFADLIARRPASAPTAEALPASRNQPSGLRGGPASASGRADHFIPDDFDPFADPFAQRQQPAPEPAATLPDELDLGPMGQPRAQGAGSLDALFGLGAGSASDPFADSPLGERLTGPAAGHDVLASLGAVQRGYDEPVPDRVPEIHAPFVPPKSWPGEFSTPSSSALSEAAKSRVAPAASADDIPEPAAADADVFLSWQSEGRQSPGGVSSATLRSSPSAHPDRRAPDSRVDAAQAAPSADRATVGTPAPPPIRQAPENITAPAAASAAASNDELLQALCAGLGTPDLSLPGGLSVELMERIGHLLREATQGTLDLLLARAATKREVRAELTMISARDNNPLKFSPDVTLALAHLLAPQGHGFLPPVEAMRDAYEDLRAHQFGFMAGLRAALADVLGRFGPRPLEKRLTQKTMLDSLLPMNRRAKLWDQYTALYGEIAAEAEDDFHTLFGREFLRAYQEQVARLASGKERS